MSKDDLQPVRWRRRHPCTAPGGPLLGRGKEHQGEVLQCLQEKVARGAWHSLSSLRLLHPRVLSGICGAELHRRGDVRPLEKPRRNNDSSQLSRRKPPAKLKVCQVQKAVLVPRLSYWHEMLLVWTHCTCILYGATSTGDHSVQIWLPRTHIFATDCRFYP